MKQLRITVVAAACLATICLIFTTVTRCSYKYKLRDMWSDGGLSYTKWYDAFDAWYDRYPANMDELLDSMKQLHEDTVSYDILKRFHLRKDPLSREDGFITYYPLYDRATGKIISYILLSAGIDGRMNTHLSATDTVFLDSWWSKINVYNYYDAVLTIDYIAKFHSAYKRLGSDFMSPEWPPLPERDNKFNLRDFYWGDKDYVVHIDCRWQTNKPHYKRYSPDANSAEENGK